jgi:hypothetical protein
MEHSASEGVIDRAPSIPCLPRSGRVLQTPLVAVDGCVWTPLLSRERPKDGVQSQQRPWLGRSAMLVYEHPITLNYTQYRVVLGTGGVP